MKLSPALKDRLSKFRKNRRAWYSLLFLSVSFFISVLSPVLMNNSALIARYEKKVYFPVFEVVTEADLGGKERTAADFKEIRNSERFKNNDNFMVFPPIPYGPNESHLKELSEGQYPPSAPSLHHPMGTDDRGRDVFVRIIYGYRNCMGFALILIVFEMLIGIIIGGIQGYFAGKTDMIIQRLIEIFSSIPFLYMILIMGSYFGNSFSVLMVTYAAFAWIGISYYIRGEFLKLRTAQYVEAARAFGVGDIQIIFRHILPNSITPIVTFLPFSLIGSISILSALDFLGYGIPAPNPSWGELIGQGRERLGAWWLIGFPSLALLVTIQLTAFVGEGLRDAFDSKENLIIK